MNGKLYLHKPSGQTFVISDRKFIQLKGSDAGHFYEGPLSADYVPIAEKPELSNEGWQSVVDSLTSQARRDAARLRIELWRGKSELAQTHIAECEKDERYGELCNAAACYVGKEKAFAEFGELSDRERKIALKAARYVLFNRTDPQ